MLVYMDSGMVAVLIFLVAFMGAVMGSFLNCAAWRIVHHESVLHGRSHCTSCNHPLGPLDLVPVLSWLFMGGKCRYCKAKVPARYPLTELFAAVIAVSVLIRYDFSWMTVRMLFLAAILFTVSLVDLEDGWIPDVLLLIGVIGYAVLLFPEGSFGLTMLKDGVIGAVALFVPMLLLVTIFEKITHKEAMGGGDLKLYALLGLYFGWQQGFMILFLSCWIGLIFALVIAKAKPSVQFPFGPSIAMAAWVCMLIGERLLQWYLQLF